YHLIHNPLLADTLFNWIEEHLVKGRAVSRLNTETRPQKAEIKNTIRLYRHELRNAFCQFQGNADNQCLAITPLVGLGKANPVNKTICHLIFCVKHKLTICTPYFNLPGVLVRNIIRLLREDKQVELIVGDKTANDFYIPED